jgi:carboxypeptidase family protein/TonB-dependent receptor-like protein
VLRLSYRVVGHPCLLLLLVSLAANSALAQLETATVSGQVVDPSGLRITGAQLKLIDIDRDTTASTATNPSGLYTFPSVRPGRYRMEVTAAGFKVVNVTGVTVNVQDHLEQNFKLAVGSVSESVTVESAASSVETESAVVSTVVDRNFAENLPMNGRSFQALIQLTPGVVLTANNGTDTGQFSVNGQRATSNYWMVDGVSANTGTSTLASVGQGFGGALGSTSVFGGTNSLVSVDALQEFRIQTSTYAPEFGRTPGAQISIATRSGTNQFHATAFDYFRNDILDANNWFNAYTNNPPLPKAEERQNDFGGTLGGPILKDRTFFFFSYEGLRLRLPETLQTFVPDLTARQNAVPAMQTFLNAYPLPNGSSATDNLLTGVAEFNESFSNPGSLDAISLRIDHELNDKIHIFGRYNYSPSQLAQRGVSSSLSAISPSRITTKTATVGLSWTISPTAANDFRLNYSSTDASSSYRLDNFGGAVPFSSPQFPSPFTIQNGRLTLQISSLGLNPLAAGVNSHNQQRQINIVDTLSVQKGSHGLKLGIDVRRLTPRSHGPTYEQQAFFSTVGEAESGNLLYDVVISRIPSDFLFRNLGAFVQDTWQVVPRLTITYGVRWDVDFAPSSTSGPKLPAVTGFSLSNLSQFALAPVGTPAFSTPYANVAPRLGVAYQLSRNQEWQTVFRSGFGLFYDLATAEAGNVAFSAFYPFEGLTVVQGTFPLDSSAAAPPPIFPAASGVGVFDPHLKLPYTLQWNVALEQVLGRHQNLTATYVGAVGKRLIQTAFISTPNPNFAAVELATNAATSNYNALQLQFQRQLSRGLQALASYTWAHSIDTASSGSLGSGSNALTPLNPNINRGPSDFDIRNAFSMGLTYDVPAPKINLITNAILRNWSTENSFQARSATPVDVYYDPVSFAGSIGSFSTNVRPDVVPGQPFYLHGAQYPGGTAFNSSAFTAPPVSPSTGLPARQGNFPRNALRGFGASQWDFAVHRDFPIRESMKLQFRAEMFNVLNHPNFGPPGGDLGSPSALNPQFGQSTQMLGQSLAGAFGVGSGALNPLYQIGGPRSIQFALKFQF